MNNKTYLKLTLANSQVEHIILLKRFDVKTTMFHCKIRIKSNNNRWETLIFFKTKVKLQTSLEGQMLLHIQINTVFKTDVQCTD